MRKSELGLFGGNPLVPDHSTLRVSWPIVTANDREAVIRTFDRGDFSGRGSQEVYSLESEMTSYIGMPYATALNSGTAALHAALASLEIGEGDEVIVPNLTFVSTAMAVVHNRSIPVFADVDPLTYNISAKSIEEALSEKTRAVIVVHLHGLPADMGPIIALCKQKNIELIEDVAQAPGARYSGTRVGSFGSASAFSLMAQKNLATCGEGGILLSRTLTQKNRAELLKLYGEKLIPGKPRQYYSYSLGWNYTLNPLQAAMARTQLAAIEHTTNLIRVAGLQLSRRLRDFEWVVPPIDSPQLQNVFHFFRVRLSGTSLGFHDSGRFRRAIQDALNAEGLNVRHYQTLPVSAQPFFSRASDRTKRTLPAYPATLDIIRSTLVIGAIGPSPSYLLCPGTVDAYVNGFAKLNRNMAQLLDYASGLEYRDPWEYTPVISDSFGATYVNDDI